MPILLFHFVGATTLQKFLKGVLDDTNDIADADTADPEQTIRSMQTCHSSYSLPYPQSWPVNLKRITLYCLLAPQIHNLKAQPLGLDNMPRP